jgi:hypothetical protein
MCFFVSIVLIVVFNENIKIIACTMVISNHLCRGYLACKRGLSSPFRFASRMFRSISRGLTICLYREGDSIVSQVHHMVSMDLSIASWFCRGITRKPVTCMNKALRQCLKGFEFTKHMGSFNVPNSIFSSLCYICRTVGAIDVGQGTEF